MPGRVKRSPFVSFWIEDTPLFDITRFLSGELRGSKQPQLLALSPLTEEKYRVTTDEVRSMMELSADFWSDAAALDLEAARLDVLARQGILLTDSDDPELAGLRRRHEALADQQWHPYAAFYHFMTREREKNTGSPTAKLPDTEHLEAAAEEDATRFIDRHGPPPSPFHHARNASRVIELPTVERSGGFYEVLRRRRTVRAFNSAVPMTLGDFTTLMRYTFGCHGYARLSPDFLVLHRTSPSGGALQPIEAYPLVLSVETLPTGFYHYDAQTHSLELVQKYEISQARDLAVAITGGQSHARSVHVLLVMTARFSRHFWKYRQRSLTYGALLMEAGHFSQTLHLVATELDLGIFFAPFGNGSKVEEILALNAQEEGPLAVCGCGVRVAEGSDLGLDFQPFVPRETVI